MLKQTEHRVGNIISTDCLYNILGHVMKSWQYSYPSGTTLESAIYEGIKPFYKDARLLGSPSTITDVSKSKDAFDIKGRKVLSHLRKMSRANNLDENNFVKQKVPNHGEVYVRIPHTTTTQVRRPKVDLKGFKGDPKKAIDSQIQDYLQFALVTSTKDGCDQIYSIVLLYGIDEKKGFKSVFLSIEPFGAPQPVRYEIGYKKNGQPCEYSAYDQTNQKIFSLSSFNKGSSNFYKAFQTEHGMLMTWPIESKDDMIYTKNYLEKHAAVQIV